jgi:2-iminobutanoate/2-iminopropanoate deaminase
MSMPNAQPSRGAQTIDVEGASTSPLSAARILNGVIYTSGQVGRDHKTGHIPADFAGQVHLALGNLRDIIHAAGGSMDNVLKTTLFLTRAEDFTPMNAIYSQYFPDTKPARSTVIVAALANPAYFFEIEAIAYQAEPGQ